MYSMIKVKQETHATIKIAAAKAGMTMQDFVEHLAKKHNEEQEK